MREKSLTNNQQRRLKMNTDPQTETCVPHTDMQCYDAVPGEPVVTPETEAAQWVADAMTDWYNS
ncbi:MAG TPA: hypothetical protein VJL59_05940 [Anaerolineales bacterium]|nr:hypothetical protein [Anaerolineales bacterium]